MAFHNIPPNGFPDIPDMEELEAVVKDVTTLKTSVAGLASDVSNLSNSKANQITIAPFFNAETAYEVGDLVYYNGLSYRCTNDHEGEWDADDFAATTIAGELDALKSGLTSLDSSKCDNEKQNVPGLGMVIPIRNGYDSESQYANQQLAYIRLDGTNHVMYLYDYNNQYIGYIPYTA